MKLAWSPDDEAFRAELVEFLDANTPPEAAGGYDFFGETSDGIDIIPQWLRTWQATLFDNGWMIPAYPPELGIGRRSGVGGQEADLAVEGRR